MGYHFTMPWIFFLALGMFVGYLGTPILNNSKINQEVLSATAQKESYWFVLHRKSNIEYLYRGVAGDKENSTLIKEFKVKTGVPGKRPTPLPKLLGRKFFLITKKFETREIPETAPYFLELNVPTKDEPPYGPEPYLECGGEQCNWELAGTFGLHGVNGDESRLSEENEGSSGCIRHSDEDIIFLYHLLDPEKEEIRYYVES